jgi:hypothetical protein
MDEFTTASKKRGRPKKTVLREKGSRPLGLHLTAINGSMFFDQYGRVLEESAGPDRLVDLRTIGLWDARNQRVVLHGQECQENATNI